MITKKWTTNDYYFGQVEECQVDYLSEIGPHKGHKVKHRESYENCGALDATEYCVNCSKTIYRSQMNGCWQQGHNAKNI